LKPWIKVRRSVFFIAGPHEVEIVYRGKMTDRLHLPCRMQLPGWWGRGVLSSDAGTACAKLYIPAAHGRKEARKIRRFV
jgi:hypothetical protein